MIADAEPAVAGLLLTALALHLAIGASAAGIFCAVSDLIHRVSVRADAVPVIADAAPAIAVLADARVQAAAQLLTPTRTHLQNRAA